ncbi:DUF998 domain-containing protein [Amycolatopsis sp. CA-230715]|uniref:DUF998 domain-containing protein n=1 Tax=Amycolatopsis sp. CA-230715 TaxID=2745196 RepID=UPI001C00E0C6|nr:DUF998 domain-containing protein [Amycolatopsis sp. CA-230715]QWF83237.1 hypothetical protein HUW46_06677 [Amycolatopsis sp. CA-230715]
MASAAPTCDPATRVTRSLLGYGIIAGPFYVVVSLVQALTRPGFDLTRHEWSLLATGPSGWIQVVNVVMSGLMVVAGAAGVRRTGLKWGSVLLAGYGIGLVCAGVFAADPADGFPLGTPAGRATSVSWHGMLHLVVAGVGFLCLIAACFVLARTVLPWFSRITGVVFFASFAGIASGAGNVALNLAFTAAVVLASVWLSVVSLRLYRGEAR